MIFLTVLMLLGIYIVSGFLLAEIAETEIFKKYFSLSR